MPTSPRNLTGGTGLYKRTAQSSNPRDDEGIVPYARGRILPFIKPRFSLSGVPSTPAAAAAPSPCRRGQGFPSSVPGCARSTFPGGEGFLRRGYDTGRFLRRGYDTGHFLRRGLQDQPFQGFFQVFLVYAGIIDDQAVQVRWLGIKGAEGLDLQALGEECLGQGFVR